MATRRKPPQVTPRDPSVLIPGAIPVEDFRMPINGSDDRELIVSEIEPPPETAADRVAAMMANADGVDRATVKLYKVLDPTTKKLGSCRDYTPEEFEAGGVDMIRKHWGPGEFVAYLYGEVDGQYSRRGMTTLAVLEDRSSSGPASPAADPAMARVLETLAQGQQQMLQALTHRPDPMANLKETLTILTMLKEANAPAPSSAAPSITSILADLRAMQKAAKEFGAIPADDKPEDLQSTLIRMAPQVLELLQSQRGGNPNANGGLVPAVTMPATLAIGPAVERNPDAASEGDAVPQTPGAAPAPVQMQTEDDEAMMYAGLMMYYNGLAKLGADPEAAADQLYDQLPADGLAMLKTDGWWELFVQFSPRSAPYREWFGKVRDAVLKIDADENASDRPAT